MSYRNRGRSYQKLGELQQSIEDSSKAIDLDPNYGEAYIDRSISHALLGEYRNAIEDCDNALRLNPLDGGNYYWRGYLHKQMKPWYRIKSKEAARDFARAKDLGYEPDESDLADIQ